MGDDGDLTSVEFVDKSQELNITFSKNALIKYDLDDLGRFPSSPTEFQAKVYYKGNKIKENIKMIYNKKRTYININDLEELKEIIETDYVKVVAVNQNKTDITNQQLLDIGFGKRVTDTMVKYLNEALKKYGITKKEYIQHFLAQCCKESSLSLTEAGWLSESQIRAFTKPLYWDNISKRNELGNTQSDDHYIFRGGGYIQITGRANYQSYASTLTDKTIANKLMVGGADYVASSQYLAWDIAAYWWENNNINGKIDNGADIYGVSRAVNIGPNAKSGTADGMSDRIKYYENAQKAILQDL